MLAGAATITPLYTKEGAVQSLKTESFAFCIQEICNLEDGGAQRGRWVEWLIRPTVCNRLVEAGRFVTTLNDCGYARSLDSLVFKRAAEWLERNDDVYRCSINVSAESVSYFGFTHNIARALASSNVDPARFCFEITEFQPISNLDAATLFAKTMRDLGATIALDDFGRGIMHMDLCAPYNYVDFIKIDRACTDPAVSSPAHRKLFEGLVGFGRSVDAEIIAEGIETERHLKLAQDYGIKYSQGYLHGKPQLVTESGIYKESPYERHTAT